MIDILDWAPVSSQAADSKVAVRTLKVMTSCSMGLMDLLGQSLSKSIQMWYEVGCRR